jgi:hypothetical protein
MKYRAIALICFLSLGALLSCGLEESFYIDNIPQGQYNLSNAIISLPSGSAEGYSYFNSFIIFYRIYISDKIVNTGRQLEGYGSNNDRIAINSTLNSDYNSLYSLADPTSTTVNTSNLESTFSNRRYFLLTLEGADINRVLGSDSLGETLVIFFDPNNGVQPTLTVGGAAYNLQRAVQNENLNLYGLNPHPDRRFLNHPELYNIENITNGRNADVATNSASDVEYTYVSMYIAARGTGDIPPRAIYSQPTFIGIFNLSRWSN